MTPLAKLKLCAEMMQDYGFNPIDEDENIIWLKLSKSEMSIEREIDMKSFDVYEYL